MKEGTGNRQSFDCAVYPFFFLVLFVSVPVPEIMTIKFAN